MDREKVIKGLECCTFIFGKRKCDECPYQKGLPDNGCYQLQDDFHALLKEQEAVKPIPPTDESDLWRCGYCQHQIIRCAHQQFCEECGRKIKWKDM